MKLNQQLCLKRRPVGEITRDDFFLNEKKIPELDDGQFLVRNQYISIDPAMRGWMQDRESYFPPVGIGEPMRGLTVGCVEASRHPHYSVGDMATGMLNLQSYAVSDGFQIRKVDINFAPASSWLSGLGMPGITAYFGLMDVGRPKAGDTVVVSAAAGAVGSIVGQIAKNLGCRVIGIVGCEKKCRFVTNSLGFDAAINYKTDSLHERLREFCPDKIDVYFDNVAGKILDTVLPFMNKFGRIPLCGVISSTENNPTNLTNISSLLVNRILIRGFIMSDYVPRLREAVEHLMGWYKSGRLVLHEDIREATLEQFPDMINHLFQGRNFGKLVMKIGH
ncbi:NADP-dependent oxidoreductase [Agrobacterium rosae]|uniref:NADP-dependent oxidoreductase n=1 Tax=Agrobacterium rosae TaxID=1972867 RepID=UPI003A809E3E